MSVQFDSYKKNQMATSVKSDRAILLAITKGDIFK